MSTTSASTTTRWIGLTLAFWLSAAGVLACSGAVPAESDISPTTTLPDSASPGSGGQASDEGGGAESEDGGTVDDDAATVPGAVAVDAAVDVPVDAAADAAAEADAGPPALVGLRVSSPTSDALTLEPAFSPAIHDYSVRCAAGSNALTVSMAASRGASSLLVQPFPSPARDIQTLDVNVTEDQAIVAAATNAAATTTYWVRCLPHDFPLLRWTPHEGAGPRTPGYYLLGTGASVAPSGALTPPTSGCFAMVLDRNGVPVWYSRSAWANGYCVFDVDSVVPGAVSFDSIGDAPSQFEVHALDPLATTRVEPREAGAAVNVDLHELRVLPNGNYVVLSSPFQPGVDLTGMQVPLPDGSVETLSGPQTILGCNLLEVQPDGEVVWSWKATDHFDAVADSVAPALTSAGPFGITLVDPFHCNAVDVDETSGNLLVSAREMNSVFYIERSTGRVLWKMGGAQASKDGATYVAVADPFALQHDARFLPDWSSSCNGGSGHISLFDDEVAGEARPARAVVYDVAVGLGGAAVDERCGDAAAPGTATVAWQREGAAPSLAMGSFRILPDGSRVIGWGLAPGLGFTEVDADGVALADLTFDDGTATYRAIKVPLGALDLGVLRRTSGLP